MNDQGRYGDFFPFSEPMHGRVACEHSGNCVSCVACEHSVGLAQGNEVMAKTVKSAATYWKTLRGSYMIRCDNSAAKTQRVYSWERQTFEHIETRCFEGNREAAKGFARLCLKIALRKLKTLHDMPDETIETFRKGCSIRFADVYEKFCCGGTNGVFFCKWGWQGWTIAHEIAHFIDAKEAEYTNDRRAGHGTDWLGWYRFLLVEACGYSKALIVDPSLAKAGLRYRSI